MPGTARSFSTNKNDSSSSHTTAWPIFTIQVLSKSTRGFGSKITAVIGLPCSNKLKAAYNESWQSFGNQPLSDVVLRFVGGECKLCQLPENTTRTLIANLLGESELTLSFKDSSGKLKEQPIDIYLEPGYSSGQVQILVDEKCNVSWINTAGP